MSLFFSGQSMLVGISEAIRLLVIQAFFWFCDPAKHSFHFVSVAPPLSSGGCDSSADPSNFFVASLSAAAAAAAMLPQRQQKEASLPKNEIKNTLGLFLMFRPTKPKLSGSANSSTFAPSLTPAPLRSAGISPSTVAAAEDINLPLDLKKLSLRRSKADNVLRFNE
jgi:hypothetical protein